MMDRVKGVQMTLLIRMNTPARHRKWFYEVHFRSWEYKKTTRTSAFSVLSLDIPLVLLAQVTVRVLRLWFGTAVSLLSERG